MIIYKNKKTGAEILASEPTADGFSCPCVHYKKRNKAGGWTKGSWTMRVDALEEKWVVS